MALVVLGSFVMACGLILWGIIVFRTGYKVPASIRLQYPIRRLGTGARVRDGLVGIVAGTVILASLLAVFIYAGPARLFRWIEIRAGLLLGSLLFLTTGALMLWKPERALRMSLPEYPEIVENRAMVVLTRVLGVVLVAAGVTGLYIA